MVFIEPKFDVIPQDSTLDGIFEIITKAGYVCYKTHKKITKEGAEKFVNTLIKSGHMSVLEHGTVYLKTSWNSVTDFKEKVLPIKYAKNRFSKVNYRNDDKNNITAYITTNYRVLVENGWLDDLQFLCEPTEYHEKRVTVRFWMDRVGSQSVMRHRGENGNAYSQESTRFCNYTNEKKFGEDGVKISIPHWVKETDLKKYTDNNTAFLESLKGVHYEYMNKRNSKEKPIFDAFLYWFAANDFSDFCYSKLIDCGMNTEDARAVLPMDLSTEFYMTAFVSDWKHFFDLRADGTTGKPHPDINKIAVALKETFISDAYM